MPGTTVRAGFGSASAAEAARHELIGAGIAESRITMLADVQSDALAGEYPGQPFGNQPGQQDEPPGDSARSHPTCSVSVLAESSDEAERIATVLERHGARCGQHSASA